MRSIEWVNQLPGLLCSSHFIYIEHESGESPATVVENFACICPGCTKISAYDKCLPLKHEPVEVLQIFQRSAYSSNLALSIT